VRYRDTPPKLPEIWENALVDLLDGLFRSVWSSAAAARRRARIGDADDRELWRAFADEFGMEVDIDRRGRTSLRWGRDGVRFQGGPLDAAAHAAQPMRFIASGRPIAFHVTAVDGAPKGRRRTGDPAFDGLCACFGDPNAITTGLTQPARARLADLIARGGLFDRGSAGLTLPVPLPSRGDAAEALQCVFDAASLVDHDPSQRLDRLLMTAQSDTAPGVQARALSVAARGWPHDERVLAALAAARAQREPMIRMIGLLHADQLEAAVALIRSCELPALVELVVDAARDEQLLPILVEASNRTDLRLLDAVAVGALRLPVADRLPVLTNLGPHTHEATPEDDVSQATGKLLASTFPPQGADPLEDAQFDQAMLAFISHPQETLALAAAQALAEHASWRSLATLRAALPQVSRRVGRRLEAAIEAIQARAGDDRTGHVSIAEPDAHGRVSVHPDSPDPDA
jgi:hypothetical protein